MSASTGCAAAGSSLPRGRVAQVRTGQVEGCYVYARAGSGRLRSEPEHVRVSPDRVEAAHTCFARSLTTDVSNLAS
jgi:hypothetical protein